MANAPTQFAFDTLLWVQQGLSKRITQAIVSGIDTNGCPTLAIGTGSAGTPNAFIRCSAVQDIGVDAIGNAQRAFSPHLLEIAIESNYAGTTDNVADVADFDFYLPVLGELLARGIDLALYKETNGTPPTVSSLTGSKLKTTYRRLYNAFNAAP